MQTLQLLPYKEYRGIRKEYSIIYYYLPFFRKMYRHRVELCLDECRGGDSILEVGFGGGLTFFNIDSIYNNIFGIDLTCDIESVKNVFNSHGIFPNLKNGNVVDLPYSDNKFDTVLLISILEHLKENEVDQAFSEIRRVLKPGGQVVYGVPIERPLMVFMFRFLGVNIREHHFSTEKEISTKASEYFNKVSVSTMKAVPAIFGDVYQIGHFIKS